MSKILFANFFFAGLSYFRPTLLLFAHFLRRLQKNWKSQIVRGFYSNLTIENNLDSLEASQDLIVIIIIKFLLVL